MPADTQAARAHLEALAARPRPAGGEAEREARAHCERHLQSLGFATREVPFEYSAFPGRWATSAAGGLTLVTLLGAGHLGAHGAPGAALGVLLAAAVALGVAGGWLARHGVLRLPLLRERSVNLEARPLVDGVEAEPRVWLLAHLDSKSQPVPMAARAGGITVAALAWIAMLVLAALGAAGMLGDVDPMRLWGTLTVVGALASLPVLASVVGARSAGAVDDASGVASVLLAAARLSRRLPVGVLLTSAEELGLAGARAWVAQNPGDLSSVLNCDGVDDEGRLVLMYSGERPARLVREAEAVAAAGGPRARAMRLLPGVLVDAVALADAGRETATVSRGTTRTLRRVHRPSDDLDHLRGVGIPEAAALLAALAERLARRDEPTTER